MVKLNILNMENFLQAVNSCRGRVDLLYPDGKRENINGQYEIQKELLKSHRKNGDFQRLTLEIPDVKDYMNMITYYAGNF